eukprot:Anaeramoba_ignava/c16233_g1_i2.p2 GENE.c16233_g1_i2~~c16233_g1_i2.p2  ORF type:complete len:222 (+),score=17.72 c16233_g1_i2:1186-1851(+)
MSKSEEKKEKETKKVKPKTSESASLLDGLLTPLINKFKVGEGDDGSLQRGLENLNLIKPFSAGKKTIKNTDFEKGVMGFRRYGDGRLNLTIACGKSMVRKISLKKFIAMVENLHDEDSATIQLQGFEIKEGKKEAKGQILARINYECCAISIIQGVTGRVIRGPRDIALFDNYYIDRSELTAFYIAAKAQIDTQDSLEEAITTYEGWKDFVIPLDPTNPKK